MIVILQQSMSTATMEQLVDVNVRLNYIGPETAIFQNIVRHSLNFQKCEIKPSFVGLTWLLTGINEGKILFLPRSMCNHAILWICSHN